MPEPDLLTLFVEPLHALGFDYMVTGSVASMLYGEPRLTNDVDLVLDLGPADAPKLRAAFSSSELDLDSLRVLAAREGVLELWREVANAPQDPTPPASNRP